MTEVNDYPIVVFHPPSDGGWVATIPDLPGGSAHGETPDEALDDVSIAMGGWLEVARDIGKPFPEPTHHAEIWAVG